MYAALSPGYALKDLTLFRLDGTRLLKPDHLLLLRTVMLIGIFLLKINSGMTDIIRPALLYVCVQYILRQ
jgi:hypothetical protein